MSQLKNGIILPGQGAVPRPFLVCWETTMVNEENIPQGSITGDTICKVFRMTVDQLQQIKIDLMEMVARNLPETSLRPKAITIRQIMELEE